MLQSQDTTFHLKINQKTINVWIEFLIVFGVFWHNFPFKILTKIQSKTNAFFIRKINETWCQNDLIWEARGGSNEPAFRSLNLCWGRPGAQGDPRAPQGRPRHRPGSQHFPKWSSKCSNNDPKTTQEIPNKKFLDMYFKIDSISCLHLVNRCSCYSSFSYNSFRNNINNYN